MSAAQQSASQLPDLFGHLNLNTADASEAVLLLAVRKENWPQAVKVIAESEAESLAAVIDELDDKEFSALFLGALRCQAKAADAAFKILLQRNDRIQQIPDEELDTILDLPSQEASPEADDGKAGSEEIVELKDALLSTTPQEVILARIIAFLQTDHAQRISIDLLESVQEAWTNGDEAQQRLKGALKHGIAATLITLPEHGDASEDVSASEARRAPITPQFALDLIGALIQGKQDALAVVRQAQQKHWQWCSIV